MLRSSELSASNVFSGVRFVLLGFDSDSEEQYRLDITQRGGVYLGNYDPTCTHVIVCGRIYDDPICVMARDNGKIVVTENWVDDTLDLGARANETKVLYRPVKDLDGISGSKSLHICLTGYQRQEREDIMRMVTMMGARFSKPLAANQITHLICYKFEGEKYELAKRVNIKLVNHRWLEDCLKAWAILPIDNYTKSGWELEMMELEARDSEEETDNNVPNKKALQQTIIRHIPSLDNGPSSAVTANPVIGSPAPRQSGYSQPTGQNQFPTATQPKDVHSKMMANLPLKHPLSSGPSTSVTTNLSSQSPAPGPVNNSKSSSSIQVATVGTGSGLEKINLAVKSPSLHSGPAIPTDTIPVKSHGVTSLKNPSTGRLIKNPDLTTPEVNLSIKAPSLQRMVASSSAVDPPVKSSAPGPFNNQAATDQLETMLHEESGSKKLNVHVKSPFTTGNHTPTAVSGLPYRNSDLRGKSLASYSSKDLESPDKVTQIDSRSEKMVNPHHIPNGSTRQVQDAHIRGEKDNLVTTLVKETKSREIDNSNAKSPLVTKAKDLSIVQTPLQCISPGKGIAQGKSCINPQKEVRNPKEYSLGTPCTTKSATLSLSENKETSELISSTNLVITGNSGTSPQVGIGSKKGLSVPCESLVETPKYQDVSSGGQHGSCGARSKKSYARKLRKKSASPEVQQSDSSVNTTTPKVILAISSKGLEDKNGDKSRDVELEKIVEQSCASLAQKRKASNDSIHSSPHVANEFEGLECISSIPRERNGFTDEQVQHRISNGTDNDAAKLVQKTSSTKKTSLKRAKTPRCTPSNLHNIGVSMLADRAQVEEKMEPVTGKQPNIQVEEKLEPGTGKQPNVPDFYSHFGSPTENIGISTSTFLALDEDNEMRHALNQSKNAEENKMLEIKGLSPDSLEAELNKPCTDASSAGARIKKAVAKRSMKRRLQNSSKNSLLKSGNNSGMKPDSSNNAVEVGTSDKREASDAGPRDADSDLLREVTSNSIVNPQTDTKSPENKIKEKAIIPDGRQKSASKNVSRKNGAGKDASEAHKESSIQKDGIREKMTNVSKSCSKSNVTMDWLLTSTELDPEKENKPVPGEPSTADSKSVLKCNRKGIPIQKECTGGETSKLIHNWRPVTCFILSGHRLQRKEFQAVIKKLRGRVCRDSHNWSFQATHFIVPGPVRRTEKFFAAAASGRWILKMEYLTASNEAGRFVEEEPYEWHSNGMTEDSSISLEAPRKWRLMREQTGHGAFYGMQIVIYGECIAPSLDTLKRVIKAGDGTILATSPPYTRILKSNCVDFAVIPATTPSNDLWVREFLNHQIPCVTSDYLVEYVCKPGYPLSKHVLFQTQEWAYKSLQKLIKSCQEVVCEFNSPLKAKKSIDGEDSLRCAVCGSHDREEVMLICGDESGSVGCGIGSHIDCSDPPIEAVPDGDWFCCKCSEIRSKKSSLARKGNKRSKKV